MLDDAESREVLRVAAEAAAPEKVLIAGVGRESVKGRSSWPRRRPVRLRRGAGAHADLFCQPDEGGGGSALLSLGGRPVAAAGDSLQHSAVCAV